MAKARAEMSDSVRQPYNVNARKIMALPESVRKARYRWRKVTAERSAIVPVAHGSVQKTEEDGALRRKEISKGVYEILPLEHTNDSTGKLVDCAKTDGVGDCHQTDIIEDPGDTFPGKESAIATGRYFTSRSTTSC